ncbi:MAG: CoA transferase, partial [Chloroflexi bacterium]|nr:CoA transferase [Chloroflexota bacterium]
MTTLGNTPAIPTEGALAGLKVLDLMWVVAGPTATRAMADFGATVVRVESANRIETARGIGPYHNNGQGPDHSGLFSNMNINKLGLSLNLGTDEG